MAGTVKKALALAGLGVYVFPIDLKTKKPYAGTNGHLDATIDADEIATIFMSDFPEAGVAVNAGRSGFNVLDIDVKNGYSGHQTIQDSWLEIPDTYSHNTPNGGVHMVYAAPEGVKLSPAAPYKGLEGLDRRAGSSYLVWYGEAPESREVFSPAPKWLCEPARERTGGSFDGGLDEWLGLIPQGEPDNKVIAAIERIPEEFGHVRLVEQQYNMVRLAAEGHPGVSYALDALRDSWLVKPWDTDDYSYEFDAALASCVEKYGETLSAIKDLPDYADSVDLLGSGFDTSLIFGEPKDKRGFFDLARALVASGVPEGTALAVLWSAPTVRSWSREWGIEFVTEQLAKAEAKSTEVVPNPALEEIDGVEGDNSGLLTDDERNKLCSYVSFIDRYLELAKQRSPKINAPYHEQAALTILSLAFSMYGFIPINDGKTEGLNLYQISFGDSSTGKSDSTELEYNVLDFLFKDDQSYNFGANISPEAHDGVLKVLLPQRC